MNDLKRLFTWLQASQTNAYRDLRLVPSATPVDALLARAQAEKWRRQQAEPRSVADDTRDRTGNDAFDVQGAAQRVADPPASGGSFGDAAAPVEGAAAPICEGAAAPLAERDPAMQRADLAGPVCAEPSPTAPTGVDDAPANPARAAEAAPRADGAADFARTDAPDDREVGKREGRPAATFSSEDALAGLSSALATEKKASPRLAPVLRFVETGVARGSVPAQPSQERAAASQEVRRPSPETAVEARSAEEAGRLSSPAGRDAASPSSVDETQRDAPDDRLAAERGATAVDADAANATPNDRARRTTLESEQSAAEAFGGVTAPDVGPARADAPTGAGRSPAGRSADADANDAAARLDVRDGDSWSDAILGMALLQRLRKAPLAAVGRDTVPAARVAVYSPSGGSGVSTVAAVAARALAKHRPTTLIDTDGSGSLSILTTSRGRSLEVQHSPLSLHAFNGAWAFGGVTTWFLRASHIDRWLPLVVGEPAPGPTTHWVVDWPRNYWSELFDVMGSLTALLIPLRMDTSALIASERMASMLIERGFIGRANAPRVVYVLNGFRERSALHRDLHKHFSERFASIASVVTVPYDERFDDWVAAGEDVIECLGLVDALLPVFDNLVTGEARLQGAPA